jgi:hypothetical protein
MPRLAPLDNEVIFKKAFSDKTVLESFVSDVTGIPFTAATIETEKQFDPPVAGVRIRYDIFAQSEDGRAIIELQRVRYDWHFDRFLHYHLAAILEQPGGHEDYRLRRTVHTIVLLTAPYRLADRSNRMIEDSLLISSLDPRTLADQVRPVFGHQLIFLNPSFPHADLPRGIPQWLDLVNLSLRQINWEENEGEIACLRPEVRRAAQLIAWDGLSPDEREQFMEASETEKAAAYMTVQIEEERRQKEEERRQKEAALAETERLRERLRALGVEP